MTVRDHGRILCSIWRDDDFRSLSAAAQRLYMLLLSQPSLNNAGVLPLMPGKWAKGCCETSTEDVSQALCELTAARFAVVDENTEEVLIRAFVRNDGVLAHPNVFKNALRCAKAVESPDIRRALATELRKLGRDDADRTAEEINPEPGAPRPEPDPNPIPIPSECDPDPIETPSGSSRLGLGSSNRVKSPSLETNFLKAASRTRAHTREADEPLSQPVPPEGWALVRETIPDEHPQSVRSALAVKAAELLRQGTPKTDIADALALWLAKPSAGAGLLPSLVSEVVKNRSNPAQPARGSPSTVGEKARGWLAIAADYEAKAQMTPDHDDRKELLP